MNLHRLPNDPNTPLYVMMNGTLTRVVRPTNKIVTPAVAALRPERLN